MSSCKVTCGRTSGEISLIIRNGITSALVAGRYRSLRDAIAVAYGHHYSYAYYGTTSDPFCVIYRFRGHWLIASCLDDQSKALAAFDLLSKDIENDAVVLVDLGKIEWCTTMPFTYAIAESCIVSSFNRVV